MGNSRGNASIQNISDWLNSVSRVEDDFGSQGWPLQDMLGVSKDATDGIGHICAKPLAELGVIENLDVSAKRE